MSNIANLGKQLTELLIPQTTDAADVRPGTCEPDTPPRSARRLRRPGRGPRKPLVILFLGANPQTTTRLGLAQECAAIRRELRMTLGHGRFRLVARRAVTIHGLMRDLTRLNPAIIHFSGHGAGCDGLALEDEDGQTRLVTGRALALIVKAAARSVRAVVLNACHSAVQAEALRSQIDCVVGMDGNVGDNAARIFACRFYSALGNGRSVGNAVDHGVAALAAFQLREEALPRCLTRDGIDAHQVVLARRCARTRVRRSRRASRPRSGG